jgi:hypothetical protein
MSLNISDLVTRNGVGRTKMMALVDLINAEKKQKEIAGISSDLYTLCKPYLHLPAKSCLGRLNSRLESKIDEYNLHTVADVIRWIEAVDVKDELNYGHKTHEWAKTRLSDLSRVGPNVLVFGQNTSPQTADEFVELYFKNIENPAYLSIFKEYFADDKTLDEIGKTRTPPVTRERIRQIMDIQVRRDSDGWSRVAADILDVLTRKLDAQNGVVTESAALSLTGAKYTWQIDLLSKIAGRELHFPRGRREGIVCIYKSDELSDLCSELGEAIDSILEESNVLVNLQEKLKDYGFEYGDEFKNILPILANVEINGDRVYDSRKKINTSYVETLRSFGRPATAREITEKLSESDSSISNRLHTTITQLRRSSEVFKTDDHKFVHEEHLGFSVKQLKALAVEACKLVPRNGSAVNVRRLLKELSASNQIPASLSPFTLRDAMMLVGDVRSWRAGCDVAWICENTHRLTIPEYFDEIAPTLDQPFSMKDLVDSVCKISGYLPESVKMQFHSNESTVHIGYNLYVARSAIEPDSAKFDQLVNVAASHVPAVGVVTGHELAASCKELKLLAKKHGPGLIWGLAKLHKNIVARSRGLLLYSAAHPNLWSAFKSDPRWKLPSTFTSDDLRKCIIGEFKINTYSYSYYLLKDAMSTKEVSLNHADMYTSA